MGLALTLAAMVSIAQSAPSRADDDTSSNSAPSVASAEWYTGGTLQHASTREWLEASTRNQLATAGDWVLTSKRQQAKVAAAAGDMSLVLSSADKLRQCINRALRRHSDLYSSTPAADIAVTCIITLKL